MKMPKKIAFATECIEKNSNNVKIGSHKKQTVFVEY